MPDIIEVAFKNITKVTAHLWWNNCENIFPYLFNSSWLHGFAKNFTSTVDPKCYSLVRYHKQPEHMRATFEELIQGAKISETHRKQIYFTFHSFEREKRKANDKLQPKMLCCSYYGTYWQLVVHLCNYLTDCVSCHLAPFLDGDD